MVKDAVDYARRCHACQIHANLMHQSLKHLHPSAISLPFKTWGMDIVGPIFLLSIKGDHFILAITDYFSKWAEAVLLREVKTRNVIKFIKHYIIYRYRVPRRIVHDNGPQFVSNAFIKFCGKFRIEDVSSTAYNLTANELAKVFNKTILKILSKLVRTNKRDWDDKLGKALWAYRTTVRMPTGQPPYSVY
ncbi:protein NYNRIN-like [Asparagus officinalis]|uniref:protein NYNRIN-like n=1 Tax=Asparagus officinalis TaxID=4686 RepID=UPI00098E5DFB|nr:protein NYNRIN-like [Asparagus officinalis]